MFDILLLIQVREKVGPEGHVIGAVSGGVDSSVAAVLLQKAIGELCCVSVVCVCV